MSDGYCPFCRSCDLYVARWNPDAADKRTKFDCGTIEDHDGSLQQSDECKARAEENHELNISGWKLWRLSPQISLEEFKVRSDPDKIPDSCAFCSSYIVYVARWNPDTRVKIHQYDCESEYEGGVWRQSEECKCRATRFLV